MGGENMFYYSLWPSDSIFLPPFEERVDEVYALNTRALDVENSISTINIQRPEMMFQRKSGSTRSRTCQTLSNVGNMQKDWEEDSLWYASVYESDSGGVYKSEDAGSTWTYSAFANPIYCVRSDGENTVYAGGVDNASNNCFHYSTDGGDNWTSVSISLGDIRDIAIRPDDNDTLLAADLGGGVRRSTNKGVNWSTINSGLSNTNVYQIRYCPEKSDIALAGTAAGVFKCTDVNDASPSWSSANYGGSTDTVVALDFHADSNCIVLMSNRSGTTGDVFISADTARSWIELDDSLNGEIVYDFAFDVDSPYVFYAATDEGVYEIDVPVYSDTLDIEDNLDIGPGTVILNGDVVIDTDDTLTIAAGTKVYVVYDFDIEQAGAISTKSEIHVLGRLVCNGTNDDSVIFLSSKPSPEKGDWVGIKAHDGAEIDMDYTQILYPMYGIYAVDSTCKVDLNNCLIYECDEDGIYTTDGVTISVDSCKIENCDNRGIYLGNHGRSSITYSVLEDNTNYGIYATDHFTYYDSLFIENSDIYHTTDVSSQYGIFINNTHSGYIISDDSISAYRQGGIKINGDGSNGEVMSNEVYNVDYYGLYFDNDCEPSVGHNKINTNDIGVRVEGDAYPNCGTSPSIDVGYNWFINSDTYAFGSWNTSIYDSVKAENNWWGSDDSTTIHAEIYGNVDWLPWLTDEPDGKIWTDNQLPTVYALDQNYPNPFNPSTTIEYALPNDSYVNIEVFNLMGQKIRTLADEYQQAGYWTVEWDGKDATGRNVSSGIYFYTLDAGDYHKVKKMALIK